MFDYIVDYIIKNYKTVIESDTSKSHDIENTIIHNICSQKTTTKPFEIHMIREIVVYNVDKIVKVQKLRECVEKLERLEIPEQRTPCLTMFEKDILFLSVKYTYLYFQIFKS